MSDSSFTVDEFQSVAATHLSFLEAHGFARDPFLEERKSTYGTVVYRGKHLAFVFSCDVRDQSIDASVVKVENGQLRGGDAGGYSSDLFMHLVNVLVATRSDSYPVLRCVCQIKLSDQLLPTDSLPSSNVAIGVRPQHIFP